MALHHIALDEIQINDKKLKNFFHSNIDIRIESINDTQRQYQ